MSDRFLSSSTGAEALEEIRAALRGFLAEELVMAPGQVDEDTSFLDIGLDSISGVTFVKKVNTRFGLAIGATKVYTYPTLRTFTAYVAQAVNARAGTATTPVTGETSRAPVASTRARRRVRALTSLRQCAAGTVTPSPDSQATPASPARYTDIAVIGMAGRFPKSDNLREFWSHIEAGRDCISEIPEQRWAANAYFDPRPGTPGKSYSRWMGVLEDVDRFDPLFFDISPLEAEVMDPQQRLFLQCCWHAIEDAGIDPMTLSDSRCAVYAGCSPSSYRQLVGDEHPAAHAALGVDSSVLASRVSYFLNLKGPSLAIDTACSSSLVALANACENLVSGQSDLALAGGVWVLTGPQVHVQMSQMRALSPDGRCYAFDQRANGFVPGEGVGVVLLKRLQDALRDGDPVHGVIQGWGINQDGKTNGITAPNAAAQSQLLRDVHQRFGITPNQIQLMEAHGTGTRLGDPIELDALNEAFGEVAGAPHCALGSVKGNIGHLAPAAGIAGVIKSLLALRHRTLPPVVHFEQANEHLDLEHSCFYLPRHASAWTVAEGETRRAGISAFGYSGTNAHLIVAEYRQPEESHPSTGARPPEGQDALIVLSARESDRLREAVRNLRDFLRQSPREQWPALQDLAFTLQLGRTPMPERLACVVSTLAELDEKLTDYLETGADSAGLLHGSVSAGEDSVVSRELDQAAARLIERGDNSGSYLQLLELWVKGAHVDWRSLNRGATGRRVSLPTYPFARERYWVRDRNHGQSPPGTTTRLHPLLHNDLSGPDGARFLSVFSGEEFFLADHRVRDRRVLPGVAYLEMVRAAAARAFPQSAVGLCLNNVVWARPIEIDSGDVSVQVALHEVAPGDLRYEIYSEAPDSAGRRLVHSQGQVRMGDLEPPDCLDLEALRTSMTGAPISAEACYQAYRAMGIQYGPSHRGVQRIYAGDGEVLAQLALPDCVAGTQADFVLHPSLMDGALQATIGLVMEQRDLPVTFALHSLELFRACPSQAWVHIRWSEGSGADQRVRKVDLDICDDDGALCVRLLGFSSRLVDGQRQREGTLLIRSDWQPAVVDPSRSIPAYRAHHILVCETDGLSAAGLSEALPGATCRALSATQRDPQQHFSDIATQVFEYLRGLLQSSADGPILVQLVAPMDEPGRLLSALVGLLHTARLEHPDLIAQLIEVDAAEDAAGLVDRLQQNRLAPEAVHIRYRGDRREVPAWPQLTEAKCSEMPWREGGSYLITGGAGGLGLIFAREIAMQVRAPRITLVGRSPCSPAATVAMQALERLGAQIQYQQVDVTQPQAVTALIDQIVQRFDGLHGILHAAGVNRGELISRMRTETWQQVLAPKVTGAVNLDQASQQIALDLFVLFSSGAALVGNPGQGDYATANAFLDRFAEWRQQQTDEGRRSGCSLSINWPLWREGGMGIDAISERQMADRWGLLPMATAAGLDAFYQAVASGETQVAVLYGDPARVGSLFEPLTTTVAEASQTDRDNDSADPQRHEAAVEFLKRRLSATLKVPTHRIDAGTAMERYGIDSILVMQLTDELEKSFGSLPKTLFFEYQTLAELADYFVRAHPATLQQLLPSQGSQPAAVAPPRSPSAAPASRTKPSLRPSEATTPAPTGAHADGALDIAVVGLSGRYPMAPDLQTFWDNLKSGRDCISEVPADRWDWRDYYREGPGETGRHTSKWGGFIEEMDKFDPLFFNISPRDALQIDPQERLFLEQVWAALEDAGIRPSRLRGMDGPEVGVYAGVMYGEYPLLGAGAGGAEMALASSYASIANRVSYCLDLHGPSMTVDTMCSSSLTCIHLACQDLKSGRIDLGIAGGVNLTIHPNKYQLLSQGLFISSAGHCESFGEGGDGYIPGEGVGVALLKRLDDALRDGDRIYGVIKGSAVNHGGKTNGYSVPNPRAQSAVIRRALDESGADPRTISYVEAHGTGTRLGDPIEVAGLSDAFGSGTPAGGCWLGSVKSNIGHCESAAGIAGLTKVLLQLKHRAIAPSLHSQTLNPHIDFDQTPFIVNQQLREWTTPEVDGAVQPRRAGLSSFGAGGSNAHLIVEEAPDRSDFSSSISGTGGAPVLVVLSARDEERLLEMAIRLCAHLESTGGEAAPDLAAIGYTLQLGREAMQERVGFLVHTIDQLIGQLRDFVEGTDEIADGFRGNARQNRKLVDLLGSDEDLQATIDRWIDKGKYAKLLEVWVNGVDLDWTRLYRDLDSPPRIPLPSYPFARESYWPQPARGQGMAQSRGEWLHPLLQENVSSIEGLRFRSRFSGDESCFVDGAVPGQRVLSEATCLEMAWRAFAWVQSANSPKGPLQLSQIRWGQPAQLDGQPLSLSVGLFPRDKGQMAFEIVSPAADGGTRIHCQGLVVDATDGAGTASGELPIDPTLPPDLLTTVCRAFMDCDTEAGGVAVPIGLERLELIATCPEHPEVAVRTPDGEGVSGDRQFDVDLSDGSGQVCGRLRGLTLGRPEAATPELMLWRREWQAAPVEPETAGTTMESLLLLCEPGGQTPKFFDREMAEAHSAVILYSAKRSTAARYRLYAKRILSQLRELLRSQSNAKVLLQLVVPARGEARLFRGLFGLLLSAEQENPRLRPQLIEVDRAEPLPEWLPVCRQRPHQRQIRYLQGDRQVSGWRAIALESAQPSHPWKRGGVYLISGGAGGLGQVVAREIVHSAGEVTLVLTGRSAPDERQIGICNELSQSEARVEYRQVDVSDSAAVSDLIAEIERRFGTLNGVIHAAGITRDGFIINKPADELRQVLAPKVSGLLNLDRATAHLPLDLFVLFSSIAAVKGNAGQADYAAANGFMDAYAAHRNRLVKSGQRRGHTLSVSWPLWADGGMGLDAVGIEIMTERSGMVPMRRTSGIAALYQAIASGHPHLLVAEGDASKIRSWLDEGGDETEMSSAPMALPEVDPAQLLERTLQRLTSLFSEVIELPLARIDSDEPFEHYGVDSIAVTRLNQKLEQVLGKISKTLFFEYHSLDAFAAHLVDTYRQGCLAWTGLAESPPSEAFDPAVCMASQQAYPELQPLSGAWHGDHRQPAVGHSEVAQRSGLQQPIAIVGISGRYAGAETPEELWQRLRSGEECISEVPAERWSLQGFYHDDVEEAVARRKSYGKWGSFIDGFAEFDSLFFNISPREALSIDPQERLFLQSTWAALEDAGYTRAHMARQFGGRVGVFAGITKTGYELNAADLKHPDEVGALYTSFSSVANRVSYLLDLKGPSMPVDTMCSSSLTAIHEACERLRHGDCELAIAGGVNLYLHPSTYVALSAQRMLSTDGRCRSFGADASGFVPGEGVGVVILKPLARAIEDGDAIHAVIRGTGVNHGGKTNGYSVPNPQAQAELIRETLNRSGVHARTISYIEAHGTGTALGDPIEVTGLTQAFGGETTEVGYCALGSIKSNLGHLEAAAGMAGLTKVVMQMKRGEIAPSLHAETPNPNIDFAATPFAVQQRLAPWKRPQVRIDGETREYPRRAGISSFGAGGANAHLVLEEYIPPETASQAAAHGPHLVLLSAKDPERLREMAGNLQRALSQPTPGEPPPDLRDLAYTLQVGREAMEERCGMLVRDLDELLAMLDALAQDRESPDGLLRGRARRGKSIADAFTKDEDLAATLERWLAKRKYRKLLELWLEGVELEWEKLYSDSEPRPRRVHLPSYPFARQRHWFERRDPADTAAASQPTKTAERWQESLYVARWEAQPLEAEVFDERAEGTVLVLHSPASATLADVILQHHASDEAADAPAIRVRLGSASGRISGNEWCCDVRVPSELETLLRTLAPFGQVYFLADSLATEQPLDGDLIDQGQQYNELSLLRLVKALQGLKRGNAFVDLILCTVDCQRPDSAASRCWGAGLTGLAYAVAQGDHRLRVRNIDVAAAEVADPALCRRLLSQILAEPAADRGDPVRLSSGMRYRQRLLALQPDTLAGRVGFKSGGVYVLLGGSGTLGRILSRYLIDRHQAQVVWIGRSPDASPKVRDALEAFADRQPKPLYLQADAVDPESLQAALGQIKQRFSRISGAIFSAVEFATENSVAQTSEAEFLKILEVKSKGSWNFYDLLRDEPLDFLCYFSSGQTYAFSGAVNLSAYAAGITFSDALVRTLNGRSRFPVGTINWGFWRYALQVSSSRESASALEDHEGLACVEGFLWALQQGHLRQLLCLKASPPVRALMDVVEGETLALQPDGHRLPMAALVEQAQTALPEFDQRRETEHLEALGDWVARLLFAQLRELGLFDDAKQVESAEQLRQRAGVVSRYRRWWRETLNLLVSHGYLKPFEDGLCPCRESGESIHGLWQGWSAFRESAFSGSGQAHSVALIETVLRHLPVILRGERPATDLLFADASMERVEGVYGADKLPAYCNRLLAQLIEALLEQTSESGRRLRIIEVGAGTGGTTSAVLKLLRPHQQRIEEYCYTDISRAFLLYAEEHFGADFSPLRYRLWNIEQEPAAQGIELGRYDLVIATDVLHATQDVRQTLRHIKSVACRHGLLLLNEISQHSLFSHVTFGLLEGWWRYRDAPLRIPGSPIIAPEVWQQLLEEEGFGGVQFPAPDLHALGRQLLVAESDGLVRLATDPVGPVIRPRSVESTPRPIRETATPAGESPHSVRDAIVEALVATLKMSPEGFEPDLPFSDYGVDSILGAGFVRRLGDRLGIKLNAAVLFEHSTIRRLAAYLTETFAERLAATGPSPVPPGEVASGPQEEDPGAVEAGTPTDGSLADESVTRDQVVTAGDAPAESVPIAVIGMSGRFPGARDIDAFWNNLIQGADGVGELAQDYLTLAGDESGPHPRYRWGGVMEERACFDPLFFNLSPREAESMNPHQRIILEEGWRALEDAGYNPKALADSKVGLFIGSEPNGYAHDSFTGASDAIIATRLSYFLDLKGPALVVNTGCSSSAVALHLACESLRRNESSLALAGGVFAALDQKMLTVLDDLGMLSPSGRCRPLDADADGTAFSEGAGVVVLKRLDRALADGDPIHGVIEASGINQDGSSNGITAPNGVAQEALIAEVFEQAAIDVEAIGYVEMHGTGTSLGDPVEANALVRVFRRFTDKQGFCALGSAKAHIGHTSASAGVIGLIKVLLSMRHQRIPGLLHFSRLNPLIELEASAFYVNREPRDWPGSIERPRWAALNSFGHSGTNVHLVLREYPHSAASLSKPVADRPLPIPLSAKSSDRLREVAGRLLAFLHNEMESGASPDLASLAYTLQVGREAMDVRLGLLVQSTDELRQKLQVYLDGEPCPAGLYLPAEQTSPPAEGTDQVGQLLQAWVDGGEVDWQRLWGDQRPSRIHLPTYPFERERYWAPTPQPAVAEMSERRSEPSAEAGLDRAYFESILEQLEAREIAVPEAIRRSQRRVR